MSNTDKELFEYGDEDLSFDYGSPSHSDTSGPNWGMMIGLIVAMAAVAFIVLDGLKSETYFYPVDEALAQGESLIGQTVRIKGVVETGTITGTTGKLGHTFQLAENGESIKVVYHKALPDTFHDGAEVVAQGKVDEAMTLQADEVLVKCPSRYEGAPPTADDSIAAQPQAAR